MVNPGFLMKSLFRPSGDAVPESLDEVCVEQAEAETSEAGKDAIAEGHDGQDLHIALEQRLGVGLGDGKYGG